MSLLAVPRLLPASFRGQWRITIIFEAIKDGKTIKQCMRVRYDIFEYSD